MSDAALHVTLIVNPEFGEKAIAYAELGPIWVISSDVNQRVMRDLWAQPTGRPAEDLTLITATIGHSSPEDVAASFIGTIDEHHPDWTEFEVIGAAAAEEILGALREIAHGTIETTQYGFVFSRNKI
jgi:hypothetical protein